MKIPFVIGVLTASQVLFAQQPLTDAKTCDPAALSFQLTSAGKTEKEKVTAIFHWITDNISYKVVPKSKRRNPSPFGEAEWTDTSVLPSLSDRVAGKVLEDGSAFCEGYARLFYSLCEHAGIRSAIITGYARVNKGTPGTRFRSNHTWNAVYFDSAWHLLDATWASGYLSGSDFVKEYDGYYFLTPPEQFNQHHFPDDQRWTLLEEPPLLPEFRKTPFRQRSFVKYSITSFSPARGIIDAFIGDTIRLELEAGITGPYRNIAPDSLWDSASLVQAPAYAYVRPAAVTSGGTKLIYSFPVESTAIRWLYVMYNNDAVLRYGINVRKADNSGKQ